MMQRPASPWLGIPAADYEGHMASPAVGQLQYLGGVFQEVLAAVEPESLVLLGCATGNGLEHVTGGTRMVIGIDINPEYIEITHDRYASRVPGLVLISGDVASLSLPAESIDLVHAALFLEYVDPALILEKAARWLRPDGVLAVVLQLPADGAGPVTTTPFTSLKALEPALALVPPETLHELAVRNGLEPRMSRTDVLPTGKRFHVALFVREGAR